MSRKSKPLVLAAAAMLSYSGTLLATEDTASDVTVTKDLTAVIALQGLPCGQVVSASQQAENDYLASCQDGHRYRLFVNADGRVVVETRD